MEENDWRLRDQMEFLIGVELVHLTYNAPSQDWDHDHCIFCWEKFQSEDQPAYCTTNHYYWICEECFDDFKEMFRWKLVTE